MNKRLTLPAVITLLATLARTGDWQYAIESSLPKRVIERLKELDADHLAKRVAAKERQKKLLEKSKNFLKQDMSTLYTKYLAGEMKYKTMVAKKKRAKLLTGYNDL